jgi:hypothetical protein
MVLLQATGQKLLYTFTKCNYNSDSLLLMSGYGLTQKQWKLSCVNLKASFSKAKSDEIKWVKWLGE